MTFSFNFLPGEGEKSVTKSGAEAGDSKVRVVPLTPCQKRPFVWIPQAASEYRKRISSPPESYDQILVSSEDQCEKKCLARVRERSKTDFKGTDLIPGEYEGGDVVWECSIDLCRYLCSNGIVIRGSVLELGCGHGLPGVWVLREAWKRGDNHTSVCFTDFNEFVLDSTMNNIVLNTRTENTESSTKEKTLDEYVGWLVRHALLGSGDWNELSMMLSADSSSSDTTALPAGIPLDGMFDCILAAETTYSTAAAMDTARFVTRHLKRNSGVAYIATKRYYFGVGGGSDAFREGIQVHTNTEDNFQVETKEVFDNGVGNIRELLRVTRS